MKKKSKTPATERREELPGLEKSSHARAMDTSLGLAAGQVGQWVPTVGQTPVGGPMQPNLGRMRTSPPVDFRGRTPFSVATPIGPVPSEFGNTVTEVIAIPESEGEILKLLMRSGDLLFVKQNPTASQLPNNATTGQGMPIVQAYPLWQLNAMLDYTALKAATRGLGGAPPPAKRSRETCLGFPRRDELFDPPRFISAKSLAGINDSTKPRMPTTRKTPAEHVEFFGIVEREQDPARRNMISRGVHPFGVRIKTLLSKSPNVWIANQGEPIGFAWAEFTVDANHPYPYTDFFGVTREPRPLGLPTHAEYKFAQILPVTLTSEKIPDFHAPDASWRMDSKWVCRALPPNAQVEFARIVRIGIVEWSSPTLPTPEEALAGIRTHEGWKSLNTLMDSMHTRTFAPGKNTAITIALDTASIRARA